MRFLALFSWDLEKCRSCAVIGDLVAIETLKSRAAGLVIMVANRGE